MLIPTGLFNPGKIVDAPKMDDRRLFRYGPDYAAPDFETALDWSAWPGAGGGFLGARGDVQQQWCLPQAKGRHHVPVLSGLRAMNKT